MFSEQSKKYLLAIARQTITDFFTTGKKLSIPESKIEDNMLREKAATFVTLTINGQLRGCIGSIIAKKRLYEDVINNALMAGFGDPRFSPLKEEELSKTKIEISILSKPISYNYNSVDDLREKILPNKHGVIIQKDFAQATFLPQVWKDLPTVEEFMSALCQKAGLDIEEWKNPESEIFYYTVENFSE